MLKYIKNLPRNVKIVLTTAFLLRLTVWLGGMADSSRFLDPDSVDYLQLAEMIGINFQYTYNDQIEIFRAPGYPFLIALLNKISESYAFLCLIQIILDTALCFLLWRLASRLYDSQRALAALSFQCVSIVSITFSVKILSDSIYAFLLILFLNILNETWHVNKNKERATVNFVLSLAACGIVLSFMIYLRAITLLYLYIPIIMLFVGKRTKEALATCITIIICIAPWYYRNYKQAEYPHFSSVGSVNLYRYNACLLLAEKNDISFNDQQKVIDGEFSKFQSQTALAVFAAKRGKEEILSSPLRYIWLHMKANINNFLPAGGIAANIFGIKTGGQNTLSVLHTHGIIAGVNNYFHGQWWLFFCLTPTIFLLGFVYCFSAVGMLSRFASRKLTLFELILILGMFYFLLVPGGAAHPRFRVPAAPILSLFAGLGFVFFKNYLNKRNK